MCKLNGQVTSRWKQAHKVVMAKYTQIKQTCNKKAKIGKLSYNDGTSMNKTNKLQQVGESREWRSFNSKKIKTSISNYDQYKNTTKGQKKNPLQILEIKM
jgi:hypothetical protein